MGTPIYYVPEVGIGSSTTPTSNLQVTGNVYVSNALTTTNLFANTLTLANASSTINVIGSVTASTFYGVLAGSNTVSGTTMTAIATPAAAANVLTVIGSSTTGNVVQFSNSAGGTFVMTNAGRVGIGTAVPTRPFHLYGSMRLDMNAASYSTQSATQTWTGGTWYQLVAPSALTNLGQAITIPTTYLISMTWQQTGGNPYNLYCSFLYNCGWCNDTSANQLSGATVPTSYHATNNAGDFQVSIRGNSAGNSYTGFDFKVNATTTTGYWIVKAMIISYY